MYMLNMIIMNMWQNLFLETLTCDGNADTKSKFLQEFCHKTYHYPNKGSTNISQICFEHGPVEINYLLKLLFAKDAKVNFLEVWLHSLVKTCFPKLLFTQE